MGSSVSCLCARPEDKVTAAQRCSRRLECCNTDEDRKAHDGVCKHEYIHCPHGKVRDGDWSRETAVLAECSPACWTEVRAAQLDWHRSHAPQDLYAQASAEAFASSRQALQAFARLSGKAAHGSEAAALSLIREPGSSPPVILEASPTSQTSIASSAGQQAALATVPEQPLSKLCHELPISQIMQGSHHLRSQALEAENRRPACGATILEPSLQGSRHDREALCCSLSGSCTPGSCCGRAEWAERSSELCARSSSWSAECRTASSLASACTTAATTPCKSGRGPEMSSSAARCEDSSEPQPSPLRNADDAEKIYQALASPFHQPPPRRSISYQNVVSHAHGPPPSMGSSSFSGVGHRMPDLMSSPFLSDQGAAKLVGSTPFSAWQPMEGSPFGNTTAPGPGEGTSQASACVSPFFCSEPPLRSGSEPAPLGPGAAPKRLPGLGPGPLPGNPNACKPASTSGIIMDLHKELRIEPLMQLVCTVLQCEAAMLTLLESSQILVMRNGRMESRAETEASPLPGLWPLLPITASCETTVVPNVDADSRMPAGFREQLGLGFFCAKPLCSAVCRRVGTLCIGSKEPREFSAGPLGILNNLSELMVHEIEAACERANQRQQSEKLLAAMDLYQDAFMLVDTTVHKWRILHLNLMAANEIGAQREEAKDAIFWDLFQVRNPHTGELAEPWVPCEAAAVKGQKFVLHKVRLAHGDGSRLLTMRFRPACQEMQSNAFSCGLPLPQPGQPFYFVEVSEVPVPSGAPLSALPPRALYSRVSQLTSPRAATPRGVCPPPDLQSGPSQSSLLARSPISPRGLPEAIPFQGLELGYVLGRGAFGSVFQGTYNGRPVAVKIIVDNDQARVKDGLPVEAHITAGLNHRNVVRTIAHAWRPLVSHVNASMSVWDSAGSNAVGPFASCNEGETWLLLELCDRGTLQEAIISGFFKGQPGPEAQAAAGDSSADPELKPGSDKQPGARMDALLSTAMEVANGMMYLHARSIVHGDLTGANVLLQECAGSPTGITAKVADFGLSREMQSTSRIETRTCGTITHMPPELLSQDVVSKAADVYAFGVLLWELYHGVRAWDGFNHAQVIHAVAIMNSSLEFSPGTPAHYQDLSKRCMSVDASLRPTFEEVVAELHGLEAELAGEA